MPNKAKKTGKELERRVADAYRQMGARTVKHDVELVGNQVDVYVELEMPGSLLHCIAIEVKDWAKPVGIDVVNGFAAITKLLRHECLIDEGVIVSASGFSRPARNAAETYGIQLLEPADLDAVVAQAQTAGQTQPAPPSTPPSRAPSTVQPQTGVRQFSGTVSADVHRKPQRTTGLDTRILQTLYDYLQEHPGDPKVSLNELIEALGAEQDDVLRCLLGLREKEWLDYNLTESAETGLVWLKQLGTRVAKDAHRS